MSDADIIQLNTETYETSKANLHRFLDSFQNSYFVNICTCPARVVHVQDTYKLSVSLHVMTKTSTKELPLMTTLPDIQATDETTNNRDLITEKSVARELSLSPRTLRNWRVLGIGPPYVKISARCIRYRRSDIETWSNNLTQSSTSDQ